MKRANYNAWIFLISVLCILGIGCDALAADVETGWRKTYDSIMGWINFGILSFLIVKFVKKPLKDFIEGLKKKAAGEVVRKQKEMEAALNAVKEIRDSLNESEASFAALKDRIVDQGEKRKQQIIEEAGEQSRQMLANAQHRVEIQILQAKKRFKSELVDAAADLAMKRLPDVITAEDNQRLVNRFLAETGK